MSSMTKIKFSAKNVLALVVIGALSLSLGGCFGDGGANSYDEPTVTKTANVLIDAATLQGWIDLGLVNNANGFENVVIVDVTSPANYSAGHIPGAVLWDSGALAMTRLEGPSESVNMVLDGASMDAQVKQMGIDERTTIVLTSSLTSTYWPSRAYFLFRYWGWDKSKLKVLNGYNSAWAAAGKISTIVVPDVTPSDFSVTDNGSLNADERVSLGELITALSNSQGVPIDTRGATGAAGTTEGVFDEDGSGSTTDDGEYVVYDGVMKGAVSYAASSSISSGTTFKDAATIKADLALLGVDGSEVVYSYCRTGVIASTGYFIFDAILGWEVMLYDGSWSQWGQMSDDAAKGGVLSGGSAWATDNYILNDVINYNSPAYPIETLATDSEALAIYPDPSMAGANQIENADAQYMQSGTASGDGAAPGYK